MFALEFLNFAYNVGEFASRSEVFYQSPFNPLAPGKGVGVGLASGTVPGDLFGGITLGYSPFSLSLKAYRSGDILITTLPDTSSPPSEDNPPEVVDRVKFGAYEGRVSVAKPIGKVKLSTAVKVIYAGAGKYGRGVGGGLDASLLYSPLSRTDVYLGLYNLLTSPVVWSTGKRELALPTADLRLRLRAFGTTYLILGGEYVPDGRGFSFLRDGFLALRAEVWRLSVFGGLVEGKGRLGISYRHRGTTFSFGTSYHYDFGYSFLGSVSFGL